AQRVARLFAEAALAPAGARGALATFGAPVSDPRAMGIPVTSFSFSPLVAADDVDRRRLLARAAVEGVAFSLRANLEQAARLLGAPPRSIHAGGGLTAR